MLTFAQPNQNLVICILLKALQDYLTEETMNQPES
jgi:hypothetical protein